MGSVALEGFGGGGSALNFRVVGNPQPSTAKENTIWVDTDIINNYYFSAEQPENMVDYDVWFPVGTSSHAAFNALKKNGIQVYPLSAKQYIDGVWVNKTAKSYQDGEWVDWATYLYSKGNMHTELGGAWTSSGYSREGWGGFTNYAPTNTSDGLKVNTGGTQISVFGKESKVDLTEFSEIRLVMAAGTTSSMSSEIWVTSTKSSVDSGAVSTKKFDNQTGEMSLDVSAITGSYYIAFSFHNGTAIIEEVALL